MSDCEVRWYPCHDRQTRHCPQELPRLQQLGFCNSSHGGSCCACGGRLPDLHIHFSADGDRRVDGCAVMGDEDMAGNICSEGCMGVLVGWIESGPHSISICPGHGRGDEPKWESYPYREKLPVRLRKLAA